MGRKAAKAVLKRISPEIIRIEKKKEDVLSKLNQLYEKTPAPGIPLYARKPQEPSLKAKELKEIEKEKEKEFKSLAYLKTLLRDEKAKVMGDDYHKLVAKVKFHHSSNPFRRTVNNPLLKLLKLDRGALRERWVIEKILIEDRCGNGLFLDKLADIIRKPSTWSDGRVNEKLFNLIKNAVKQNPGITFGEVHNMVTSNMNGTYEDEADLRKLCKAWGFKFASAKKGRKGRV